MDERQDLIEIDLTQINSSQELHQLLKDKLSFPHFYGMNWDAFWDSITGLVEMPRSLILIGWNRLEQILPTDSKIMKECLRDLNTQFPKWKCEIEFK